MNVRALETGAELSRTHNTQGLMIGAPASVARSQTTNMGIVDDREVQDATLKIG
jgi:hypothetical protein